MIGQVVIITNEAGLAVSRVGDSRYRQVRGMDGIGDAMGGRFRGRGLVHEARRGLWAGSDFSRVGAASGDAGSPAESLFPLWHDPCRFSAERR